MATVDWAIQKAFLHAQRKPTPPVGTKYNALLGIADSMSKLWASEPNVEWSSLYSPVTLSSTVSATDTFAIPTAVNYISKRDGDPVLVGGNAYKLVQPNQLYSYRYDKACAQIGTNLKFSAAFDPASSLIGASIVIPAILDTTDITSGSQAVQVDDPMWLVYMMAAEFCRNDVVKSGQYQNLLDMADEHMQRMKQANGGGMEAVATPWAPMGETWR